MQRALSPFTPMAQRLLALAFPVALARLGVMSMGIVDTIMVGQLAPDELAWQALGWAPTGTLLVTGMGLLMGVQVLAARMIGEGRAGDAGGVWRRGVVIALIAGGASTALLWLSGGPLLRSFGIEETLADKAEAVMRILAISIPIHLVYLAGAYFLEAVQRPAASMIVMWAANIVNIGLNAALIPSMGAEGSAWATVGARVFLAAGVIAYILLSPRMAVFAPRAAAANAPNYRALLHVGAAAAVSQAAEAGAFSAMTVIAGRISEQAVAAYAILINLLALPFMLALGLASATAVLVAEALGRNSARDARHGAWLGLQIVMATMAAVGVAMLIAPDMIARAFTADVVLAGLVGAQVGWVAAVLVPDGGQVVTASALRARGDNWFPTASHIAAYVLVMPPLGYYLAEVQGQGVGGLVASIFWASVLSVAVLAARQAWLTMRQPGAAAA